MPNLLQRGATAHARLFKLAGGVIVTIAQGPQSLVGITGWVEGKFDEVVSSEGILTKVRTYDWTFLTADLNGLVLRNGATITDPSNNVYEVLPSEMNPSVETLDKSSGGIETRVRTKLVRNA